MQCFFLNAPALSIYRTTPAARRRHATPTPLWVDREDDPPGLAQTDADSQLRNGWLSLRVERGQKDLTPSEMVMFDHGISQKYDDHHRLVFCCSMLNQMFIVER